MSASIAADAEQALHQARTALLQASDLFEKAGFGSHTQGLLEEALVAMDSALDSAIEPVRPGQALT